MAPRRFDARVMRLCQNLPAALACRSTPCPFLSVVQGVAALAILFGGGVACGAHERSTVSGPRSIERKCGAAHGAHITPRWLQTKDGQRLYAAEGGRGTRGIVLAPESPPGDVCGWLPYMATLERSGFRVLAFDFRGTGDSPTPATPGAQNAYGRDFAAAIAHLRREGATTVVVIGASLGGARALAYGAHLDADGIISLSGEALLPEYHVNALRSMPSLRTPLLIVGSRHDTYLPVPSALRLLRRAGSQDKQSAFFPGSWHGWDIVENAPYAKKAQAVVLTWIRTHTPPP
jgi:esterase/lipase